MMPADSSEEELKEAALKQNKIIRLLEGKQVKRIIVIKNKLVNIVI